LRDAKVRAALEHWAPRFVAQGIDYNDFARTVAGVGRWEEWLDAWVATANVHARLARDAEAQGWRVTAGEAHLQAALCYHFANFVWMVDKRKHRAAAKKAVAALRLAHRLLDPTAERVEVPFEKTKMIANLRRPRHDRPPLVILIPGLDSTKEEFFHWENVFLRRGMATLSLDGPGQGETGYKTHIRPDYEVAVRTMLDALVPRADLDLSRVGVAGVSLGGYYAPRAAAFEPRIKAVVTVGGPYSFGECWDGAPSLTRETFRYHAGARSDTAAKKKAALLDLRDVLPKVRQPFLVVFGKLDRLIPWQQAERVAAEAPNARLVMYPDGNHVCNNIPYKYRPLVGDWMTETLARVD
jgi:pimeloyl-ACP methyl ester carboxylesterase